MFEPYSSAGSMTEHWFINNDHYVVDSQYLYIYKNNNHFASEFGCQLLPIIFHCSAQAPGRRGAGGAAAAAPSENFHGVQSPPANLCYVTFGQCPVGRCRKVKYGLAARLK